MFTDASRYCWGATFCQYISKSGNLDDLKPMIFIPGKYLDTQYNYAAHVREAFTKHISVKRLCFCLQDDKCTMLFFHKLLQKFLKPKTEKNEVNI